MLKSYLSLLQQSANTTSKSNSKKNPSIRPIISSQYITDNVYQVYRYPGERFF